MSERPAGVMPEDVADPPAVETSIFEQARAAMLSVEEQEEIRWVVIGLSGRAPDTELVGIFSPAGRMERRYGLRFPIWPAESAEPQLAHWDVGLLGFLADGVGADARLGRLEVPPGAILWLPVTR
jgi:hypothetical protein